MKVETVPNVVASKPVHRIVRRFSLPPGNIDRRSPSSTRFVEESNMTLKIELIRGFFSQKRKILTEKSEDVKYGNHLARLLIE